MTERPGFLFVTCQVGAEGAVKCELARRWGDFRFAFSRPGFLTFKLPAGHGLVGDFDLESIFAQAYGFSLGRAGGQGTDELARNVWQVFGDRLLRRIHVWSRLPGGAGEKSSDAPSGAVVAAARDAILARCPRPEALADDAHDSERPAQRGEFVMDCVLVEPEQWWVGYHRVGSVPSQWPGGVIPLEMPPEAVSRAWLKMEEGLRWSQLPVGPGARVAEIGSAPGGASQALLGRGLEVTGIDPAAMDPAVLEHPRFRHIRRRAIAVRRRDFRKIRWLAADMNVAPKYTLDVLESIVRHPTVSIRGMLITLKLIEWPMVEYLPECLRRIRSWGYNEVRARHLVHNRHEVCVAALARPFVRKRSLRRR